MLIGAKGVILYDPEGSVRDSPFPKINGKKKRYKKNSINLL